MQGVNGRIMRVIVRELFLHFVLFQRVVDVSFWVVTRTTPVGNGGKFTKEARDMYTLVLKMQNVRPTSFFRRF